MHLTRFVTPYQRGEIRVDEQGQLQFAPDDPHNPRNYSLARKYWITAVAMALVVNATFSSSAPTGSLKGISEDLHVSEEAAGLVTTLFLSGYVAGPLFWAPLVSNSHLERLRTSNL